MAENDQDILIVDDCGCGCHCNDVELRSDHQPDVLLFDEYAEAYENDIVHTRETVDDIKETVDEILEGQEGLATEENATANKEEIIAAMPTIPTDYAKEATLGSSPDTSVSTTIFGWLKSIRDYLVGIVTTNPYAKQSTLNTVSDNVTILTTNVSEDLAAIKSSVKSGNDTDIAMLKDSTNGLAAIKAEAAAAKTAAQAITGYAKETNATQNKEAVISTVNSAKSAILGTNTSATNTAILQAIQQGGGGGTGDAKESTSQAILHTLPQFRVENNDTLVIYTGANESEKIVPVYSTGVYRMKWSEEIESGLDLETLLGQFLADLMDDDLEELIEGKDMSSYPISIQVMNKDIATELYYIALDNAEPYWEWETIADIVDQAWDGETYIYIQFRFHDFPFTENSGYSFDDFMYYYYWKLSYPIHLDEYGILSYTDVSRPIVDIIEIESSDESN